MLKTTHVFYSPRRPSVIVRIAVPLFSAAVLLCNTVGNSYAQSRTGLNIGAGIIGGILSGGLLKNSAKSRSGSDEDAAPRKSHRHSARAKHDDDDDGEEAKPKKHRVKKAARSNGDDDDNDNDKPAPKAHVKDAQPAPAKEDKAEAKAGNAGPATATHQANDSHEKPVSTGSLSDGSSKPPAPIAGGNTAKISTAAEIKSAQQHLKYLGYDVPSESGSVDLKTKIAVMQYQESLHAPTTGELTVEQLQLLFKKAAEKQSSAK